MANEEKEKSPSGNLVDEVKGVAGEVYKDAVKPSAIQIGQTLEKATHAALALPNLLLASANYGLQWIRRLQAKIEAIPSERLLPAPPPIVAPAAMQVMLLGEGPEASELRDMFENLVMSAMDSAKTASAHPAFVSIISQLTRDEALLLKSIDYEEIPYMELSHQGGFRTLLGKGIGIDESRLSAYIYNLVRLGIIALHDGLSGNYESATPDFRQFIEIEFPSEPERQSKLRGGSLLTMQVTPFGRQFIEACVHRV